MYIDWTRVILLFLQRPSKWWLSQVIPHLSVRFSGRFAIFGDVWSDCRWLDISPMPSCWWYPKLAILPCATSLRRPPMREEGPFFLPPKPFQRGVECENCARKIGGSYIYIYCIYTYFFFGGHSMWVSFKGCIRSVFVIRRFQLGPSAYLTFLVSSREH